ncbi:MAG: hypothetical protein KDD25_01500, partial [Bdellovibrionales bacterium]|nr:hypothetical protein [Bdellovibrionales bacterium]
MRTKVVIDRFSDMVARQYGCGVKFHNLLDPADQPDKPTLELVRRNKLAKVIIQKDDILIPIEKDECLYGLIRIKDALVLGPDTIDKLYDLSEMLVKSVVISELKKQIMERLENYLLAQLSEDEIAYGELKTKNKEFASQLQMSQRLAEQKVPVLILAKTGAASEELAREIHKNSSCLDFQVFSQID